MYKINHFVVYKLTTRMRIFVIVCERQHPYSLIHWNVCGIHWEKGETVVFATSKVIIYWVLRGHSRVRFPSLAPLLHPSFWTVYRRDRAVGILIIITDSMSLIWDMTLQLCALISVILQQLMDLLLLPLLTVLLLCSFWEIFAIILMEIIQSK